jgi:6-pyruvoyl-tetrahydropterin synthase
MQNAAVDYIEVMLNLKKVLAQYEYMLLNRRWDEALDLGPSVVLYSKYLVATVQNQLRKAA